MSDRIGLAPHSDNHRQQRSRTDDRQSAEVTRERALLALQRSAGNQAVIAILQRSDLRHGQPAAGFAVRQSRAEPLTRSPDPCMPIQRTVTIAKQDYAKKQLPKLPSTLTAEITKAGLTINKVTLCAQKWQKDDQPRSYDTPEKFYRAVIAELGTEGKGPKPDKPKDPAQGLNKVQVLADAIARNWAKLKFEVHAGGGLRDLPWDEFGPVGGPALEEELKRAKVQQSSNWETSAFHGNTHGNLPKTVVLPVGAQELSRLPASQQADLTDYIEFLIVGRKKTTEIERGIFDRKDGSIFLTAHYDKGSFVRLVNPPAGLVADWRGKANVYHAKAKAKK